MKRWFNLIVIYSTLNLLGFIASAYAGGWQPDQNKYGQFNVIGQQIIATQDTGAFTISTLDSGKFVVEKTISVATWDSSNLIQAGATSQFHVTSTGLVKAAGGSSGQAVCWKSDGTLGWASTVNAGSGATTCN